MALNWEEVVVDCRDFRMLGHWWADALSWTIVFENDREIELQNPDGSHPTILFADVPERKSIKNRLHFDFVPDDQAAEVERLVGMGATPVDIGQDDTPWVVLADPEGNEFCVLKER